MARRKRAKREDTRCFIEKLPNELMNQVAGYLDEGDIQARLTCERFATVLVPFVFRGITITTQRIAENIDIVDRLLAGSAILPYCEQIVDHWKVTPEIDFGPGLNRTRVEDLARMLENVHVLHLSVDYRASLTAGTGLNRTGLKLAIQSMDAYLSAIGNLRHLALDFRDAKGILRHCLPNAHWPHLTTLVLRASNITEHCLTHFLLSISATLEVLTLGWLSFTRHQWARIFGLLSNSAGSGQTNDSEFHLSQMRLDIAGTECHHWAPFAKFLDAFGNANTRSTRPWQSDKGVTPTWAKTMTAGSICWTDPNKRHLGYLC